MSRITFPAPETAHPTPNGEPARPASALPSLSSAAATTSPRSSLPPTKDSAPQQHHGELKPLPYVGLHHGHQHGPAITKDGDHVGCLNAPNTPYDARYTRPHQVEGLAGRQDRSARCRLQARHRDGRPAGPRQKLHHEKDDAIPQLAAARYQNFQCW
ncbi:hypothetical protein K491DRAFT_589496 [Lophiostoma macrostomum CBS 122681]|uniref:Uncharacterized protein n=1 Tax=Lophiostoma macrostomum CBS 122681 TaxID=1314788 RepID=A0A6A6TMS4_9PLEO|nr:hypothetical protein K491DRAFT_589496 [Lophiostoma macrostomum CBS 122681]